jgi:sialate O-acetylesterase
MKLLLKLKYLPLLVSLVYSSFSSELRFAKIFTDHCVLQRDMPVPVWGWAKPKAEVSVEFAEQTKTASADAHGKWMVRIDPLSASAKGLALKATSGENSIILSDILVGEVWLASGQSNMGFSIPKSTHADEAREVIPHPEFRRFKVGSWLADEPLKDIGAEGAFQDKKWRMGDTGQWREVKNEKFGLDHISAVGAWFAHEIRVSQGVPVGLIESHFGGSMIYPWMPIETLTSNPEYQRDILNVYQKKKQEWQQKYSEWEADPNRNPNKPPTEPWRPACLYNGQISPFTPFAMRGVIWYQGESSQGRAEAYRRLLPDMVTAWRKAFQKEDLAFLAVQLPAYGKVRDSRSSPFSEMRESVSLLEKMLPHTASVVSTDCGLPDEIHPPLKKPIGQRLALAARAKVYGEMELVWSGPKMLDVSFGETSATLHFDQQLTTIDDESKVTGFAIAGIDQKFYPAEASIQRGKYIVAVCKEVPRPVAVRYAWQDSPIANLCNKEGLPVGTFRSDIWKLQTQAMIREPLILKEGGTKEKPAIFDGHGMTIDLGIEVTDHQWLEQGDIWTSQPRLLATHGLKPRIAAQTAGLFVEGIPITIPRDIETEKQFGKEKRSRCYFPPNQLEPGQMGYKDDGSLYFRWPKGISPNVTNPTDPATAAHYRRSRKKLYLPPKAGTNCVSIACSHITIRNLTVKYAGNDGFNIHGHRRGIRLEKVRALSCADEGISAHETTEMEVINSEIAWNGSISGGVTDVNDAVTTYRNCIVHDNAGAAFSFTGKAHRVYDSLIYNQEKAFHVQKEVDFKEEQNKIK